MGLTNHFSRGLYTNFDSVEHQKLRNVMREMGLTEIIVSLIEALYSEQQSAVATESGTTGLV